MEQKRFKGPTQKELLEVFNHIKRSTYDGAQGVLKFDSGKRGPTLGISIQTHGNEISGLATLWYLLHIEPIEKKLQKGVVFFVINNIKATEKYFEAETDEEKRAARFVHTNFNRLPADVMVCSDKTNYEICRAQELEKVWASFDIGLDIHSTLQESEPMIIAINKFEKDLVKGFPINIVISNIENIQIGRPASAFYGGEKMIPVINVESGSHYKHESFETAITCTLGLMRNLKIIPDSTHIIKEQKYLLYEVVDSLVFPNDSYLLSRVFPMFGLITKGDIVANGNNGPIYVPLSGCTIFGPKQVKPDRISEEVLFFSKLPRILIQG